MYSLYELLFFFIIYSILGWCVEVTYEAVDMGKFVNRGFLNGPYCPIYGEGVIIVVLCLNPIKENLLLLYFGSLILTTALEFMTGFILEKIFHQKWWDYSDQHFNLMGYICPKFSLCWGFACLIVVRLIHPLIATAVGYIPTVVGVVILIVAYVGFTSDFIITVLGIMHIKKQIRVLENISAEMRNISDHTGEKLYDTVTGIREINENISEKNEARKVKFEELKNKYKTAFENKSHVQKRIENAFPHLKFGDRKSLKEIYEEYKSDKKNN